MVQTGTFHTGLRSAIAERGLSLSRISDRLTKLGVAVSVSTLSSWQCGTARPGGDPRRTLTALESVLEVAEGSLHRLLEPATTAGRRHELGVGVLPRNIKTLRAKLGSGDDRGVVLLGVTDDVEVSKGHTPRSMRSRLVLRARGHGVDSFVVFGHVNSGGLPHFESERGCRIEQVATDEDAGLAAAVLRFAPLVRGETYAVEYRLEWDGQDVYHGRWVHSPGLRYELSVRFAPGSGVRSAHRIWRVDPHSAHKDLSAVRLIDGAAHMILDDPDPGFHGLRWE